MDDDTSNDVEEVTDADNEAADLDIPEDLPIMQLFKRLISNDNKQNTVLTNAQIVSILQHEFNMDIRLLHNLEVDIYLNIMKKFLKDWPQWDEFDRVINRLKLAKAYTSIKKVLDHKYKNLKEYLGVMLEATKGMIQSTPYSGSSETPKASELNSPSTSKESMESTDTSDVVMEVSCTRDQLNQLFFRNPDSYASTSVFNYTDSLPSRIVLNTWNIESLLNMWDIKITIKLNFLIYRRETTHILKHMLINKKHNGNFNQFSALNDSMQVKSKKGTQYNKQSLFEVMDSILLQYTKFAEVYALLNTVFQLIKHDLHEAPDVISIPGNYRQHMNKYPYVRYLYADTKSATVTEEMKYDLQLQETISPMYQFFLGRVQTLDSLLPPFQEWFKLECNYCKIKFHGSNLSEEIRAHFDECHQSELDWTCTNCGLVFDTKSLAEAKWFHKC